uniref:Secreted peptide n=1 Tax=Pristhesancus plagipennis TaxID=1955184 RepID=A0A2K8JLY4_PRIPG|nr:secreted peptide [Pristhesancus plagipennis]
MKLSCLFVLLTVLGAVYSVCWTTYKDANHKGRKNSGCTNPGKCTTLYTNWKIFFKSINTGGGCVRLWENRGCSGKHIDLRPGSPSHNNLPSLGWSKAQSIGTC